MAAKKVSVVEEVVDAVLADQPADWVAERKREREEERQRVDKMQTAMNDYFPQEVERQLKKGGASLTYIPVSEVITRLNKVLGFDGWSSEILKCERDALDPDFIVAHVRLTIYPKGDTYSSVTKDGFGGQKIKRTKQGEIVDLGDEFKGAVSDALKKAAQSLGIGLYLARTEEAMSFDEAPPAVVEKAEPEPAKSPLYESFISLRKSLDETGVEAIRKFWSEYSGGRPVPKAHEFTDEELEALIAECVRLSFAGSFDKDEPTEQ